MNTGGKVTQKEVSQYMPDWLQNTIIKQMEEIDTEIRKHENAIKELSKLYTAHAVFLENYSPFEQRDLSHCSSLNMLISPEAMPQAERREKSESETQSHISATCAG